MSTSEYLKPLEHLITPDVMERFESKTRESSEPIAACMDTPCTWRNGKPRRRAALDEQERDTARVNHANRAAFESARDGSL